MKLVFQKKANGQILVDTDSYDSRNGKYRFFEALLNIFSLDEIVITKKGYRAFAFEGIDERLERTALELAMFKNILNNTLAKANGGRRIWQIDTSKVNYKSPFLID